MNKTNKPTAESKTKKKNYNSADKMHITSQHTRIVCPAYNAHYISLCHFVCTLLAIVCIWTLRLLFVCYFFIFVHISVCVGTPNITLLFFFFFHSFFCIVFFSEFVFVFIISVCLMTFTLCWCPGGLAWCSPLVCHSFAICPLFSATDVCQCVFCWPKSVVQR